MTTATLFDMKEMQTYIQQHLDEPLTLTHLARYASYSPFHFSRLFKEATGLSPQYYVSALRLQKAKELLLQTNLKIRDIGLEIGQQSLGTFTTRFTDKVGVTPSQFRQSSEDTQELFSVLQAFNDWTHHNAALTTEGVVHGTINSSAPFQGCILIGLFAKPIPEGLPLYGTLLPSTGSFCFTHVKPGLYYLMATSVTWGMGAMDVLLPQTTLRAWSKEPIVVTPFEPVPPQTLTLIQPDQGDPPILISIPVLMKTFLARSQTYSNF
ncbi:helix-turn-helix domain-containing protein [Aureibacillus halotolerans]|uniref:AraC-like DNA-binding protein n=1 Tax=Aureibacillus halotolerans TaxID=1508390 RepID=A0A4R6TZG1_9BACI|nr:AraC family transcriptional regulator [Aureibacillus halotolerans]TDQ37743.1 AraC-like DNA-binding protein [Aureibacillus halotolerans]